MINLNQGEANEWGKLNWNWNDRNEEECEEKRRGGNWGIGEEIAGSEMEEKREEEWKAATREKEGNVKDYWGNHHNGIIGIWRGREEWGRRKRNEKGGKKRKGGGNSGKGSTNDERFKGCQANKWGKLNRNNQNEEEF